LYEDPLGKSGLQNLHSKNVKRVMNSYDRVLKECLRELSIAFMKEMFGLDVKSVEPVPPRMQTTVEQECDLVFKVTVMDGTVFLLHIEWQSVNDRRMHLRMLFYDAQLIRNYDLPVRSIVIYTGKSKMNMKSHVTHEQLKYHYILKDVQELDAVKLLRSEDPALVLLAYLAGISGPRELLIRSQIERWQELFGDDVSALLQKIAQLEVLALLRGDQELIKKEEINMLLPKNFDWKKDFRYQEGLEAGRLETRKQFEKELEAQRRETRKQIEKALDAEKRVAVRERCMIESLLGMGLSANQIATGLRMPLDQVQAIAARIKERGGGSQ